MKEKREGESKERRTRDAREDRGYTRDVGRKGGRQNMIERGEMKVEMVGKEVGEAEERILQMAENRDGEKKRLKEK